MSALGQEFRVMWLDGIHAVTGTPAKSLVGLVGDKGYQIYSAATSNAATLVFPDMSHVTSAYAFDARRFSMAAMETMAGLSRPISLPKSTGWLIVEAYYGAFFAAHSLLRLSGRSFTQLEKAATKSVNEVSDLFGVQISPIEQGMFYGLVDYANHALTLVKVADQSHEGLWAKFLDLLADAADEIGRNAPSASVQASIAKLIELRNLLTDNGRLSKGNWLSQVRNSVTYRHEFSAWYPYQAQPHYFSMLDARLADWRLDIDQINLWPQNGRDIQRFMEACLALVSLCREVCLDMSSRCPAGKSFQDFGAVGLLRRVP